MPEIGESLFPQVKTSNHSLTDLIVARIVHFIREHLVGKTLAAVRTIHDDIVYGKVGTSAAEFEKAMTGKKIVSAGQQGKYFWMIMSSPPHPVMHFGMTGWIEMKGMSTGYYRDPQKEQTEWPPKFWKFNLETEPDSKTKSSVQAAFVDKRRLARVRLVDCDGKEIRNHTPLKENGPDPVIDKDIVTEAWLRALCGRKKVPTKALLLDQANISGVGNWVADEVLYNAKVHPEQYSNSLTSSQLTALHKSLLYVTALACETLADSSKFPEDWLMLHRWGKGKKGSTNTLPNGHKITFLTVGGRTSAVVPAVQKKTGPVAGDVDDEDEADDVVEKKNTKRKREVKDEDEDEEADAGGIVSKTKKIGKKVVEAVSGKGKAGAAKKGKTSAVKDEEPEVKKAPRGKKAKQEPVEEPVARRRSGRAR